MVNENDNEARASEEEIKMIQNAFNNFDVNGDGFMSKAELKSLLQKMGMNPIHDQTRKNLYQCTSLDATASLVVGLSLSISSVYLHLGCSTIDLLVLVEFVHYYIITFYISTFLHFYISTFLHV